MNESYEACSLGSLIKIQIQIQNLGREEMRAARARRKKHGINYGIDGGGQARQDTLAGWLLGAMFSRSKSGSVEV
jgi:hypothetical protein